MRIRRRQLVVAVVVLALVLVSLVRHILAVDYQQASSSTAPILVLYPLPNQKES